MIHTQIIELPPACLHAGRITADTRENRTMDIETATRAHNVISIALGATTYRATSDEALSVANIPAGTVVLERATYALSGNVEVQVTLQLSNGDVWSLATWDSDDAYGILCETLAFIRRHTETQAATGEDADDCAYCSGNGSPHCEHGADDDYPGDDACGVCNGDGYIPAIGYATGNISCPSCNGAGTN